MNSVAKNFIYNFLAQILVIIVPIITTPYVSRILGPNGVGIYSFTNSVTNFFVIFSMLGISAYGQREIAYRRDNIIDRSIAFWELFCAKLISTVIALIVFFGFINVCNQYKLYYGIYIVLIIASALDITWFFQGMEEFKLITVRTIFVKLVSVVLVFLFVNTSNDTWIYIVINCFSVFFANIVMFWSLNKRICKVRISELRPLKHLRGLMEFFLPVIAVQIYSQIDKIMLGYFSTAPNENGYYEQARKICELLVKLTVSLNAVLMPRVSYLSAKNDTLKIKDIYKLSFKATILLLAPLMVGVYLVSSNFTVLFFGSGFEKVAILIKLSCPLILFMCLGNFVGVQYLNPTGQQNKATIIYAFSAVINIILNIILIPRFLSIGALIASLIAEFVSCTIQIILLKRSSYNFKMTEGCYVYVVSAIIMGISVLGVERFIVSNRLVLLIIQGLLGIIVYITLLYMFHEKYVIPIIIKQIKMRTNSFK